MSFERIPSALEFFKQWDPWDFEIAGFDCIQLMARCDKKKHIVI